jgi:hypothetical protein
MGTLVYTSIFTALLIGYGIKYDRKEAKRLAKKV